MSMGILKGLFGSVKQVSSPSPAPLPQPPSPEAADEKARKIVNRKRSSASQTVYTNPLGVGGQADVAKKVLLGQ